MLPHAETIVRVSRVGLTTGCLLVDELRFLSLGFRLAAENRQITPSR